MREDAWTTEEDHFLFETAKAAFETGDTLKTVFVDVANELGRTHSAVRNRYYGVIVNNHNHNHVINCMRKERNRRINQGG